MTIEEIVRMVGGPDYNFLRDNPHLSGRVILLTLGGSHAYGTNNDSSDVDIRGVALERPSDLIGLTNFEQVVNERTDTTIYGFNKICRLLLKCNPNTIEMLGCKPEHYIYLSEIGKELRDNRKLFISKMCVDTFKGYAVQQLKRLENALARNRMSQALKEKHIRDSMEGALRSFESRYTAFEYGSIILDVRESDRDDLDVEIMMDCELNGFPARQFNSMINDLKNVLDTYDKLNHRNKKKDDNHLNKHAMHLVRLYLSCIDILETGDIKTYQDKNLSFLLEIRKGKYMYEDGTYRDEFFQLIDSLESRLQYAIENTSIPEEPDIKSIQDFMMTVNRRIINEDKG